MAWWSAVKNQSGEKSSASRRTKADSGRNPGKPRVVISINMAWNIANFREGLVRALIESDYEVLAVAPPDDHSAKLEDMGCRFVPIRIDNKGVNPLRDLALLHRYRQLLRCEQPVAFLGFTIKPNVYGSLAAHSLGIPVINNISGLGTAFVRNNWLTKVAKGLYRTALHRSHTVFFQNEEDRELFVDLKLVRRQQTAVLPGSGINIVQFSPVARAKQPDKNARKFLLVARLMRDKGIEEYAAAARIVKARAPDTAFELLGFLDVENRTAISRAQVESWVGEGIIEYLGSTDNVRPYIAAADCVVLPSYREGTPRSLLEAAAMGKPLIATDVPGCRNVVEHETNGYLCRVRDASDLADKMLSFIDLDQKKIDQFGEASRAKVLREYDERFVIERYLAVVANCRAANAPGVEVV